jgi:hypothetical protein
VVRGVGAYLSFELPQNAAAGGRIPINRNYAFRDVLELFVEIAPAVGIILVPTGFDWHLQGAVGLRIWL